MSEETCNQQLKYSVKHISVED